MKRVKHLVKRVFNAYVEGFYKLNKPFLDAGIPPFV